MMVLEKIWVGNLCFGSPNLLDSYDKGLKDGSKGTPLGPRENSGESIGKMLTEKCARFEALPFGKWDMSEALANVPTIISI